MSAWLTRLLDTDKIDAVAATLAAMFARHAPGEKWRNLPVVESIFHDMVGHAKGEKRKNHWGRIKTAILANKLLWKLHGHGYPQDFCKQLSTRFSIALAQDDTAPSE